MNFNSFYCEVGGDYAPRYLNDIMHRISEIMLCVTVIVGTGGLGKTYFALMLAQIIDSSFDIHRQVVFDSTQFLELINSGLKMGSCIIIDESQFGMSSRDWGEKEQKEFMKIFQTIRSLGYCIFIIALNEAIIDNIARGYCLTHKIRMKARGIGQTMKFVWLEGKKELSAETLDDEFCVSIPDSDFCDYKSCLLCPDSGVRAQDWIKRNQWDNLYPEGMCGTIRAVYERMKKTYIDEKTKTSISNRGAFSSGPNIETLQLAFIKVEDEIRMTERKRYDLDSMSLEIEKELKCPPIGRKTLTRLREWLESNYSDKWKKRKTEIESRSKKK